MPLPDGMTYKGLLLTSLDEAWDTADEAHSEAMSTGDIQGAASWNMIKMLLRLIIGFVKGA